MSDPVANHDGGNITLTASGAALADDLTLDATVTATGGSGNITLNAGDSIIQNATGDISAVGAGAIDYNASTGSGAGTITMADGAESSTVTGLITMDAIGNVTIGRITTGNATIAAVTINSGAAVIDAGNTGGEDIVAASGRVVINTVTGVGSADAIETMVGSLDVSNTASGNIDLNETDAVSVIRLSNTVVSDTNGATGAIQLVAGGTITVVDSGAGGFGISAVDGDITLDANGTDSDVVVNHAISTTVAGGVTISADDTVTFAAAGDVTSSGTGNISVTANAVASNGDGNDEIFMTDGALIDAGSGTITLTTAGANGGNVTLGGLLTTNITTTAVSITANAGVVDGGSAHTDIEAASGRVVITAVTGVGAADAIDTDAGSLDIINATSGNIDINELNAVTIFRAQQTTADNIQVVAGGTITVDNGGPANAITVVGIGTITLDANGLAADIVVNDGIQSVGGAILLTADDDVSFDAPGDITSTTGNITITADADNLTAGAITMVDGTIINAGSGLIDLNARGNIALGSVQTTSASTHRSHDRHDRWCRHRCRRHRCRHCGEQRHGRHQRRHGCGQWRRTRNDDWHTGCR